ncbi:MAG: GGDEF domain-containing protein [candidate division Zixibacteria bacterium]|nr:GGDEF domain-containing protein [candidate division Zixibacteria bacterium]
MQHVAVYLSGVQAEKYLNHIIDDTQVSIHPFNSVEDLLTLAQRFTLDLIFMGTGDVGNAGLLNLVDMTRRIKDHTFLAIIPTILYHPNPGVHDFTAAFENGAEEFYSEKIPVNIARVKTSMTIKRSLRDLSVNPSSRLPGPAVIEKEIERQIELEQQFAVCYADLDNFKAFNDYYGYYFGDRVIKLSARIIKDVVFDLCREGFVGHIGGDDFIFIVPSEKVPAICEGILRTFDTFIPYRYAFEDRERGFIITLNRNDEKQKFPLMTLSIAVVINKGKMFRHVGEMSHMLADLKKYTKSLEGSNYVIERRNKY